MSEEKPKRFARLRRGAKTTWRVVDVARRVTLNTLFVGAVVGITAALLYDPQLEIPEKAALVVQPKGVIVEQLAASEPSPAMLLSGPPATETLLQDLLHTVRAAKQDERVQVLVLDLSKLNSAGMTKLQELGAELNSFKESDKTLIATADSYSQAAYYLAAHADEVHLHHLGDVSMPGFGSYKTYYRDLIDRLDVDWHVFKVGTFKSAVEPYTEHEMSEFAKAANREWMGDLWGAYLDDVAAARGLERDALVAYTQQFDQKIVAAAGDSAKAAQEAGLVDMVGPRDLVRSRLVELVGEDEKTHKPHTVSASGFLDHAREHSVKDDSSLPQVAVVVARGPIVAGKAPAGTIGGDSVAAMVRAARLDDEVKAIVLRVDSPGGSVFGSEVIRDELALAREAGKPVVASMGTVAASGGYWISTASDEIWAHPTTITGSIGIFGMLPTIDRPLNERLGVNVDGVGTTPFASGVRIDDALSDENARVIQASIESGYDRFLSHVATSRDMTKEDVDAVAQGRVWSGEDAHALGLVDYLGGLDDAVASAAELAELEEYRAVVRERELDWKDQLVRDLMAQADPVTREFAWSVPASGPLGEVAFRFAEELRILGLFNDPGNAYAYAFVDVD